MNKTFSDFRASLSSTNPAALVRAAQAIEALEDDEDNNRSNKLQEAVLSKFNIPDKEVGYERD